MSKSELNPYIVQPVQRALALLQNLAEADGELSLSEIGRRTQIPKATAFKYLQTLLAAGFVSFDEQSQHYRLGLLLFEMGRAAARQLRVQPLALPFLLALRNRFDESVNLAVLHGGDVLCIESVVSNQNLRMQTPPGTREGVHATSLGKSILAFLPEAEWERYLPTPLKAYTQHSIVDKEQLKVQLRQTRVRGYAIDNQETTDGAYCVGAPIFNQLGGVEAAISISAPVNRMTPEREAQFAQAVMQSALEISQRLGYRNA